MYRTVAFYPIGNPEIRKSEPGCGVLSKSRITNIIPRVGGSDEATYDEIQAGHVCSRGPVPTNGPRAADRVVGGPLLVPHVNMLGGDVGRPNAAMEPWLAEVLIVIQGVVGMQQLDAPPPHYVAKDSGRAKYGNAGVVQDLPGHQRCSCDPRIIYS